MAKYSSVKGFTVQTLSSDPAASLIDTGSWSSAADLNTGRERPGGTGTSTAAIAAGGVVNPNQVTDVVESWNGTAWTEVAEINTAKYISNFQFGTTTNAIVAGGSTSGPGTGTVTNVEQWNGSSWTETGDLNKAKTDGGASGTYTAGVIFGGFTMPVSPAYAILDETETWNGSAWTEVNDLNSTRYTNPGAKGGTSTSSLTWGRANQSPLAIVESWDGTNWTEVGDLNTGRESPGGAGTQTAALAFGGTPPVMGNTEAWDGSSWTEVSDLATARSQVGSSGTTQTAALAFGGNSYKASTETWTVTPSALFQQSAEGQLFFNSTANVFKETLSDIPAATWASAPSINTTRWGMGSAARGTDGTNENALIFGGGTPPAATALTEEWNGSAWSEDNDLNTARKDTTGFGATYTSAVCAGGNTPPRRAQTETWNGSSWTEVTDLNTARSGIAGTGTVTSGIVSSGATDGGSTGATETWDGSSWTEVADLNTSRSGGAMSGDSSTSALLADGNDSKVVEQWDGTSWTEIAELNQERNDIFGGIGNVTSAIVAGGYSPAPISPVATVNVERWDGTSWTEINNLSTGRASPGSQGSATSAMVQGGYTAPGAGTGTTETFTVALTNKTITAS